MHILKAYKDSHKQYRTANIMWTPKSLSAHLNKNTSTSKGRYHNYSSSPIIMTPPLHPISINHTVVTLTVEKILANRVREA